MVLVWRKVVAVSGWRLGDRYGTVLNRVLSTEFGVQSAEYGVQMGAGNGRGLLLG